MSGSSLQKALLLAYRRALGKIAHAQGGLKGFWIRLRHAR